MHKVMKKLVATLLAAITVAAPATAIADSGYCSSYDQVHSNSTGGDYVGGTLFYESMTTVTRSDATVTTTVSSTATGGIPGTGASVTQTTTTTTEGQSRASQEPVGYYAMNDGSIWTINCVTGEERRISSGD